MKRVIGYQEAVTLVELIESLQQLARTIEDPSIAYVSIASEVTSTVVAQVVETELSDGSKVQDINLAPLPEVHQREESRAAAARFAGSAGGDGPKGRDSYPYHGDGS